MSVKIAVMVPHPPLIIPEVGKGEEKAISSTISAYQEAARQVAACHPDTLVILSPHALMYADYFHLSPGASASGDLREFGAPQVRISAAYDTAFVRTLSALAEENGIPAGTLGERWRWLDHGTMIPLWFLNQQDVTCPIVRIGLSGLPLSMHYRLGQCIQETARKLGRTIAVIASGDLSHRLKAEGPYGFRPEGPEYDQRIMAVMGKAEFGELFSFSERFCARAGECGHRAFVIMAGALDASEISARQLSYEGPFGVGYGVCVYRCEGDDPQRDFLRQYQKKQRTEAARRKSQEDAYVKLARRSVEHYVRHGTRCTCPLDLPEEMRQRAGVFVSLKKEGQLRGCIGTTSPQEEDIAQEIIANAVSACCRDPRFMPVCEEELDMLEYSVDVLKAPEPITSMHELDVKRYGVIVSDGYRSGLLLPDLDGVDTVQEQVRIAKEKAGIAEKAKGITLARFEVVRHH